MRTIESVDVFPVQVPVTRTFRYASGSGGSAGERAPLVFVKVTDSEGETGWGEGRPVVQWSYETLESAVTTLRGYLAPAVIGLPVTDRWELHGRMLWAVGRGPSTGQPVAKAALDMAVHDLCARAAGLPLRCFLGGSPERDEVDLSYTLTAHTGAEVQEDVADGHEQGYQHFNFKAAVRPETDVEVAEAIAETVGQGAFVWADANQGLELHQARRVAREFYELGVDVLEQPFAADQRHLLRQLRQTCEMPLAVDESIVSPGDFFHFASEGLVDYLVVKVTRSGGVWPTVQQITVAEAAGLPFLVSGLTESLLARMAACQVSAAFGFSGPAALNGTQFIDESTLYPHKAEFEREATVYLGDAPGIGVRPDEEGIRSCLAEGH